MKKLVFATAVVGSLFGLATGTAAQALAAPTGAGSALDTVHSLENSGFSVAVNKVGGAPLELCTVDSIRPVRTTDIRLNHVVLQPVYLTANC
ncbi:hypothetical protein BH09ACT8_BH09ACT8_38540 [soil metagenome]